MKRRVLLFFAALFLLPAAGFAQYTQVSATVKDPNGIPYANGTISAILIPGAPGTWTLSGQSYDGIMGATPIDSNGHFTVRMGANTSILPASSHWFFTVNSNQGGIPSPFGTGPQSFHATLTITGGSQDISAQLSAAALSLTNFAVNSNITTTAATTYTVLASDSLILANGADNQGIVLPAPSAIPVGKRFTIKMLVGTYSNGPVNITAAGGAAIDVLSGGNYQMGFITSHKQPTTTSVGATVTVESDGTQYWIVAQI